MAEGDADGDVALHRHSSQVQRGVEGGGDGNDEQDEAEGDVDLVQGVPEDVEEGGQGQLHHVVYHQVDEQNVSRARVEDLWGENSRRIKVTLNKSQKQTHSLNITQIFGNFLKGERDPEEICDALKSLKDTVLLFCSWRIWTHLQLYISFCNNFSSSP